MNAPEPVVDVEPAVDVDPGDSSPAVDDLAPEDTTPEVVPEPEAEAGASKVWPGQPEGRILDQGDPIAFEGEDMGAYVIVKEDVFRRHFLRRTTRPIYTRVFHKGQSVPKSVLRNLTNPEPDPRDN